MPAALGLASLVLSVVSLLSLAPATEIGQLDTASDSFGLALPSSHTLGITAGIRLAVALFSFVLAARGMRHLIAAPAQPARTEPSDWVAMVVGAGLIVALVAVVLNFAALFHALVNHSSVSEIYNHIGS